MSITLPYEDEVDVSYLRILKSTIEHVLKVVKSRITQKEIPLEVRWEMYLLVQPYLPTNSFVWTPKSFPKNFTWYDDFYLDRYGVMRLDDDFIERVEDRNGWGVNIDELKEEILAYGYGSFKNDW